WGEKALRRSRNRGILPINKIDAVLISPLGLITFLMIVNAGLLDLKGIFTAKSLEKVVRPYMARRY
ncbi:4274_t:CDS:2, partial [Acaulospora morrowiae]